MLVPLVLVQYGVNVDIPFTRPCHQQGDYFRGLAGTVDVIHHVPYSVDDYQPNILGTVNCLPHDCYALFWRVLPQDEELKILMVAVGRQPRHAEAAPCHYLTVVGALLGVNIEYFPFVFGQFRRIVQYRPVFQRSRHDCGDVERLLALGFSD